MTCCGPDDTDTDTYFRWTSFLLSYDTYDGNLYVWQSTTYNLYM